MLTRNTLLQQRYLIVRQLGQGGMGAVYEAKDQRLKNTVALKESFSSTPELSRAFEREARLLSGLRHPALPRVIDYFQEPGGSYLVMDYIAGDDLGAQLAARGGPFPVDLVLRWADQILAVLEYLHGLDEPVVHRDIKPQNLKLTPKGDIILLDFGLSKGSASEMSRLAGGRSVAGYTPHFAPLEQMRGVGTGPHSDLYSLAATMYCLMTGHAPEDALDRASAASLGQPDPLRPAEEVDIRIPHSVSVVLLTAMAPNPKLRPQSAALMREVLRRAKAPPTIVDARSSQRAKTTEPTASHTLPTPAAARTNATAPRISENHVRRTPSDSPDQRPTPVLSPLKKLLLSFAVSPLLGLVAVGTIWLIPEVIGPHASLEEACVGVIPTAVAAWFVAMWLIWRK